MMIDQFDRIQDWMNPELVIVEWIWRPMIEMMISFSVCSWMLYRVVF